MDAEQRRQNWERRYRANAFRQFPEAARILREQAHCLPSEGVALDLACGKGGNALFLARHGLITQAWDYSPSALQGLQKLATGGELKIESALRDIAQNPPEPNTFDVIVVSCFLDRDIFPSLRSALRPNGLLYYQTWLGPQVAGRGPEKTQFRLAPGELANLCAPLKILFDAESKRPDDPVDQALVLAKRSH